MILPIGYKKETSGIGGTAKRKTQVIEDAIEFFIGCTPQHRSIIHGSRAALLLGRRVSTRPHFCLCIFKIYQKNRNHQKKYAFLNIYPSDTNWVLFH